MQQSARLLVDAISNGTHVWNDSTDTSVKLEEEANCETFRKLPKAPQLSLLSAPGVICWADVKAAAAAK